MLLVGGALLAAAAGWAAVLVADWSARVAADQARWVRPGWDEQMPSHPGPRTVRAGPPT
jgi:hypothetical protein